MSIGKFSVENPVLVNIVMVAVITLGVGSFLRLPRELSSDVAFSWVMIAVPYPGVSAEEVEKNVTIPIEDEFSDLDKVKEIGSVSRRGSAFLMVEFEDNVSDGEFARLYQDVRTELDKVELPDGTLEPWVDDFTSSDFMPVITVVLAGKADIKTMNTTALELQDKLNDIPELSKAEIVGGRDREIWVEVDRNRLEAFGIPLDRVVDAIRYRNMNVPGGTLESETRSYILRMISEMDDPSQFGSIIVRRASGGRSVRVGDLAAINEGYAESEYDARYNGVESIQIIISKKISGNQIELVDDVREVAERFKESLPEGVSLTYTNDTTFMIRDSLADLGWNALMGFGLLFFVLLFFLGWRNSIITALGIPIAFAITFMFMEWNGESLNGNSLFALVLVLGMIVDHAIVIMENSYRHRQTGLPAHEAAIVGTNEVVKPVLAATGTTVAAFLPLMILPGIMGKFMRIIPIVVALALTASTLEALIILPSHFADWGGKVKEKGTGLIGRWQGAFRGLLGRLFRRRWLVMAATLGTILITIALTPLIKQDLYGGEDFTIFFVDIKLPVGTTREVTDRVTARFEQRLLTRVGKGEIVAFSSTVGLLQTDDDWLEADHYAQITVDVAEIDEGRRRPLGAIMKDVRRLCADIPGAESVSYRKVNTGPPIDKPISFRIAGDNYEDMASIAGDYRQLLEEYPELYNIDDNFQRGAPELRVAVNEARASELGLTAAGIGLYVRNCFEGVTATTYYDEDEEIDVVVKLAGADRNSIDDITQMKIPTPDGRMIPFSTVCSLERGTGIGQILRTDGRREITVSADADDKRNVRAIMARVEDVFESKYRDIYPGISLVVGGEFEEFNRVLSDILRLFWIGLFLMYVILGAQFKSFVQPFMMILTIPFAFVGCILFLVVSRTPFSIVVMFAGVALAGICVNDSIVLISFVNGLRKKGLSLADAVVEGAAVRLRPIILTSVTTMGGLIPMAVGLGGASMTWGPMASTIIFGLFFSTVGTLVVIPCIYGALEDVKGLFRRKERQLTEG